VPSARHFQQRERRISVKAIVAYIKPHKLSDVVRALQHVEGLTGMSVEKIHGFGRGGVEGGKEPNEEHVKVEIYCRDDLVEHLVFVIEQTAHTGLRGDGKIYISEVESAVRISTGERGDAAV
jgi:nitrogen regulatory protein P-II 1